MRQFGNYHAEEAPGLHWFMPAPIGTKAIVNVDEIRRLELGFRGGSSVPVESLMITGDENIVDAQLLVQYNVKDARNFLFRVVDPAGITIKDAAETALRQVVGARAIDDVLTTEKEAVQADTADLLQRLLDVYQTGINVTEVKLQNVAPPSQVQAAFDDVVKAREDKDRIINLAEAYEADVLPKARGQAARLLEGAEAFKQERIAKATGESQRFLKVLKEFRKSREVTRQRLYLEAMEEILPGITKFIVDGDSGGNVLQFLPLTQQAAGSAGLSAP
jgi:membrane protease subunit HflK